MGMRKHWQTGPRVFLHSSSSSRVTKHKHKKVDTDSLKADELRSHSTALITLAASLYMKTQRWMSVGEAVRQLPDNLRQYAVYFDRLKASTKENQSRLDVRSDVDDITVLAGKNLLPGPSAQYRTLHQALEKSKDFEAVFVNDHAPPLAKRRYDYMKGLVVPFKCIKYTYTGSRNQLHFLWKAPHESTEGEVLNQSMKVCDTLKKSFPVYHSRALRREFVHLFGKLTSSRLAFLHKAYRRLTGNCSWSRKGQTNSRDIFKKLVVADHDFTKFSLMPSVSFIIIIPDSILGSFYTERVFVGLKENAFQPSSPIRHMPELQSVLRTVDDHPVLLLYTDGGPDHRLTYTTVQISLISIFLALDLNFLCAVRTPPYHSWKNPA